MGNPTDWVIIIERTFSSYRGEGFSLPSSSPPRLPLCPEPGRSSPEVRKRSKRINEDGGNAGWEQKLKVPVEGAWVNILIMICFRNY